VAKIPDDTPKIPKRHLVPKLEFPGEPHDQAWTLLLTKSSSLILMEIQSEWQTRSKNQTGQEVIAFALYHLLSPDEEFVDPEGRVAARLRAAMAQTEAEAQRAILTKVNELLVMAAETTDSIVEESLRSAARELASAYKLPWPPPEPSGIDKVPGARDILVRLLGIFGNKETAKITFRDLSRSLGREKDELMPILEALAAEKYIQICEEDRSGLTTLWVLGPPLAS